MKWANLKNHCVFFVKIRIRSIARRRVVHELCRGNDHKPLRHEHCKYHEECFISRLTQLESNHLQKILVAELEREIGMWAENKNSETAPYDIERACHLAKKVRLGQKSAI